MRVAPRAGNGKKTHAPLSAPPPPPPPPLFSPSFSPSLSFLSLSPPPPTAPVYRVDVSTWPVTPAAMAQKAALDRVEAMAMACGEGADMAREKGRAAAGE